MILDFFSVARVFAFLTDHRSLEAAESVLVPATEIIRSMSKQTRYLSITLSTALIKQ